MADTSAKWFDKNAVGNISGSLQVSVNRKPTDRQTEAETERMMIVKIHPIFRIVPFVLITLNLLERQILMISLDHHK